MFNFTSLCGAQSRSAASQSLLELDGGIKILVDVGWDETFDEKLLQELERHVPTLSLVLLTHATVSHLGAYAHCCKHIPLFSSVPVFATTPVISLGRTLTQDIYSSTPLASSIIPQSILAESAYSFSAGLSRSNPDILRQRPSSEEIAGYFSRIQSLKYSQPHQPLASPFSPPLNGLTITAYSAGHTLGGTIWHIQHGMESLVYAVDWNQAREHVLSGAAWLAAGGGELIEPLRRPTALVCSSKGSQRVVIAGGRSKRDELLVGHIKAAVAKGGTVLIPSDSSARVLELAYLLEDVWSNEGLESPIPQARLYVASTAAGATMRYARSMVEWMEEGIQREFESGTGRQQPIIPFDFKFVKLLQRKAQITKAVGVEGAKVIVASDTSLEWGFSQEVLRQISQDRKSLVILTERSSKPNSTSARLWDLWREKSGFSGADGTPEDPFATAVDTDGARLDFRDVSTEQLAGNELTLYQQFLARQRQIIDTLNADKGTILEAAADVVDDRSSTISESSDESEAELQGKALNTSAALASSRNKLALSDADLGIDILIRRKGHFDWDVQGKKGRERIFPIVANRHLRVDDFGDLIRPEEYLRAEEREEQEDEQLLARMPTKESAVGSKRKWDDAGANGLPNGINKRAKTNTGEALPVMHPDLAGTAMLNGDISAVDEEEEEEQQPEGPLKAVITEESIPLNLRIAFVDFCGLHDKRSFQMLIPLIRPRKLILIGGEEQETLALADDCKRLLNIGDHASSENAAEIFTPTVGQTIEASVDTNAWILKLSKGFAKQVHWQNVRGLSIVALTGKLESAILEEKDEESAKKRVKTGEDGGEDAVEQKDAASNETSAPPILDELPSNALASTGIVAQPFHVGDVRLAELRKIMQGAGFAAEFRGEGTLLVNGVVAVRKGGTGRLELEAVMDLPALGGPDPTFYDVRRKVYEGLAVVAGA